jgi:cellulose synthase/poly-beta-1,6-N-acetylglucosamine synthase-like glycosyltransferase
MNWKKWIRQTHRWLAITFTVSVIATFVALAQEDPVVWVSYVPLLPLALLLLSGLYLFLLPYTTRLRGRRRAAVQP